MLKYLDDVVEKAVQLEEAGVRTESLMAVVGQATPANLHGFMLPVETVQENTIRQVGHIRRLQITKYRDNAHWLRKCLESVGVEPIAVITGKAFDRLIAEMGLFKLCPSAGGMIGINPEKIKALRENADVVGLHALLGVLTFLFVATMIAGYVTMTWGFSYENSPWPWVGAALTGVVSFAIACGVGGSIEARATKSRFNRRTAMYLQATSWKQLLHDISDKGRNFQRADSHYRDDSMYARQLVLPPAPPQVLDIVQRCARLHTEGLHGESPSKIALWIAAEADAISFKHGINGLFEFDAIEAHLARERAIAADPILYIRLGEAVAVIAQYGDLPDERETIDRIVNSEHLL